jgi:hypothetical protein
MQFWTWYVQPRDLVILSGRDVWLRYFDLNFTFEISESKVKFAQNNK